MVVSSRFMESYIYIYIYIYIYMCVCVCVCVCVCIKYIKLIVGKITPRKVIYIHALSISLCLSSEILYGKDELMIYVFIY